MRRFEQARPGWSNRRRRLLREIAIGSFELLVVLFVLGVAALYLIVLTPRPTL